MRILKALLVGCGVIVALPLVVVLGFGAWNALIPVPDPVNCEHVPYLRVTIGDTPLTIPRKYVERAEPVDDRHLDYHAGDLNGHCQTAADPPVPVRAILFAKDRNQDGYKNKIDDFTPDIRMFVVEVQDKDLHLLPKQGFNEHSTIYGIGIGKNTLIDAQIGRVVATDKEKIILKEK